MEGEWSWLRKVGGSWVVELLETEVSADEEESAHHQGVLTLVERAVLLYAH